MEYTVRIKGVETKFETDLSVEQARAIVATVPGQFAADMLRKSTAQSWAMAWVMKLAVDASRPVVPLMECDLTKLVSMFDKASRHLKFPKVEFGYNDEQHRIRIARASNTSRNPGSLHVSAGKFGSQYFGSIDIDGNFSPRRDCPDYVRTALEAMAKDPIKFARLHGIGSGCCIFCQKQLTDSRSLKVGYGKICAGHFDLPWSEGIELHSVDAMIA